MGGPDCRTPIRGDPATEKAQSDHVIIIVRYYRTLRRGTICEEPLCFIAVQTGAVADTVEKPYCRPPLSN